MKKLCLKIKGRTGVRTYMVLGFFILVAERGRLSVWLWRS